MNLLDIHEEVIEGHILPFLEWNDLLRLRRVCKTTRDITTNYMRVHPELAPELEVNDQDEERSFKAFLKMDIPTTSLFLNNEMTGYRFFEKNLEDSTNFLLKYADLVKSLRLHKISFYFCDEEANFVEELSGLKSLEAAGFGNRPDDYGPQDKQSSEDFLALPDTFRNGLISLKIGQEGMKPNVVLYAPGAISFCQDLEFISTPFNSLVVPDTPSALANSVLDNREIALGVAFDMLNGVIQYGFNCNPKFNLKTIDFANYHDEEEPLRAILEARGVFWFHRFCLTCLKRGLKLGNVGASWLNHREHPESPPEASSPEFGHVVVSMVNVQPGALSLDMPNLKEIRIQLTSRCNLTQEHVQNPPHWPELRRLAIFVDCKVVPQYRIMPNGRLVRFSQDFKTKNLYSFFFKNAQRPQLVELELEFQEDILPKNLAVPKMEEIASSCQNLKKLTLVNWQGTNRQLVTLWNGLRNLEEVSLVRCKQLGNVAFVGEDLGNPAFLQLKNLKKLSLKGLDQMPKITNTLFSLVLCHLNLSHLILTSTGPIQSVTLAGVESLLNGKFAKSIEKFPFAGWSLAGVTTEELQKLEQKFRSSRML